MHGLGDVGSVQVIVIGILEFAVALFDFIEEDFQRSWRHLELVYDSISVEQVVAKVFYGLTVCRIR